MAKTIPSPAPIWAWQVLEDGEWGTISVYLTTPVAEAIGNTSRGHNLVLVTRREELARGQMRDFALTHHHSSGLPIRLHRFIPDPNFIPEPLVS